MNYLKYFNTKHYFITKTVVQNVLSLKQNIMVSLVEIKIYNIILKEMLYFCKWIQTQRGFSCTNLILVFC